jgi:hypothetical protein
MPVPLRPPAQPRTAARERLAAAIAHREETKDLLARIADARAQGYPRMAAAEEALEDAQKDLRAARDDEPRQLAAVALGELATTGLLAAQAAHDRAATELAQAQTLSRALGEREQATQDDLRAADDSVKHAITNVLVTDPAVAALVEEMTAVKNRMAVLTTLAGLLPLQAVPDQARFDIHKFDDARLSWLESASAAWVAAISALQTDPDAPLPE